MVVRDPRVGAARDARQRPTRKWHAEESSRRLRTQRLRERYGRLTASPTGTSRGADRQKIEHSGVGRLRNSVAIIGAGPYGLAVAAHLQAEGVETMAFGEPMSFWEASMPVGMLLRSSQRSSSIADPNRELTLEAYGRETGTVLPAPLPCALFVEYGHWFQGRVLPGIDRRGVVRVDCAAGGFSLLLSDGETVRAGRVVVAAGVAPFAYRPSLFASLSDDRVSHSSAIRGVDEFRGSRIVIIGAGQSALEGAALLHEAGAEVEVIARARAIKWLSTGGASSGVRKLLRRALYPPTDVGPPGLNWIAGTPDVLRWLPATSRAEIEARCTPPMGSGWLRARLAGASLTLGRSVVSARAKDGRTLLVLDDGSSREVDHIVLATGYRVDIAKYTFLGRELLGGVRMTGGYPRLSTGLSLLFPDSTSSAPPQPPPSER